MSSSNEGGSAKDNNDDGKTDQSRAMDAMKKLNIQDLLNGMASKSEEAAPDMSKHKFWQTQPVPRFNDTSSPDPASLSGPIDPSSDTTAVRQDPYPLIPGFEWVTMDLTSPTELQDVYTLLAANYVEDTEAAFRFEYSASFLNWALKSPGWRREWHIGIRASASKKLVAFISGVPCTLRVRKEKLQAVEINFLCVHKKLRTKRLAPVLIREITRRCNLQGIWQAIYTGGTLLPTPVATCRYYHRALDWPKLHEVGFSPMPPGSTRQRQVLRYKLPDRTSTKGLRVIREGDVKGVLSLLQRYLDKMGMAQEFTEEEVRHWLLCPEMQDQSPIDRVVHTYVVEEDGKITDFFSFYLIPSTVIGKEKVKSIKVAYLFYYASEAAFSTEDEVSTEKKVLKKRLNELMHDALILAKKDSFDVFNALTLLDNPLFLQEQKFGAGDGRLHYYLYNYRTPPLAGGIDAGANLDVSKMGGVGVVML